MYRTISVVLITRNQAWNIERLIESVLEHVPADCVSQIVLVDSASADETITIARRFPVEIIRLPETQRLTAALGRYVGFNHTTGDYVLFLDGDMELLPGWLEQALPALEVDSCIAAISGQVIDCPLDSTPATIAALAKHTDSTEAHNARPVDVPHGGGAALYRRAVLDLVGPFNPQLYSDEEPELCLRIRSAGFRVVRLERPFVYHYSDPRQRITTLLRRRRRRLYLGFGQNIRLHLRDSLLAPYIRERGFGLLPGLLLIIALGSLAVAPPKHRRAWETGWLLVGGTGLTVDAVRRGSLYASVFAFIQKLIILEGTVRGFFLPTLPLYDFQPQIEFVQITSRDGEEQ
ncbi:MAG: glycosyltransferase [Chloroflexi bacterium]|nr:glycosyltransferase [Chloroflexota bacterium]